jgi:hypothetical protein
LWLTFIAVFPLLKVENRENGGHGATRPPDG